MNFESTPLPVSGVGKANYERRPPSIEENDIIKQYLCPCTWTHHPLLFRLYQRHFPSCGLLREHMNTRELRV